jgi:hypothetical protein
MSVRLIYLNGYSEDFRIDRLIPRGAQLPLGLGGERSYLKQIEMTYRSRPDFGGQAVIRVFGEPTRRAEGPSGPAPGRGDKWAQIGCQEVSLFGRDRDSIRVGRRKAASPRLATLGAMSKCWSQSHHANGSDDIPVRNRIRVVWTRPGTSTRTLHRLNEMVDAPPDPVDIVTRQRINKATVCVEGLRNKPLETIMKLLRRFHDPNALTTAPLSEPSTQRNLRHCKLASTALRRTPKQNAAQRRWFG